MENGKCDLSSALRLVYVSSLISVCMLVWTLIIDEFQRYNFNPPWEMVEMSAALRINVDGTISRKSEYKCHSRFKDSYIKLSSYLRVACATGRKSKRFSTYEAFPESFEIPWKIRVSRYHRETLFRHDKTRRCELLTCCQGPVLLPFSFFPPPSLSSFTPSSALHPLSRL